MLLNAIVHYQTLFSTLAHSNKNIYYFLGMLAFFFIFKTTRHFLSYFKSVWIFKTSINLTCIFFCPYHPLCFFFQNDSDQNNLKFARAAGEHINVRSYVNIIYATEYYRVRSIDRIVITMWRDRVHLQVWWNRRIDAHNLS